MIESVGGQAVDSLVLALAHTEKGRVQFESLT